MLFPKTTEINKRESLVLAITQFCAEMTIQKKLWFSQVKIVQKNKKENHEEFKTFSIEILFLTLSEEEKNELTINRIKIHPKITGEFIFKKILKEEFSLEKINLTITTNLKENLISSFIFLNESRLIDDIKYPSWMSEKQKNELVDFLFSFSFFI